MRLALLDPAPGPVGDGSFDASDLQAFRDAYVDSGPVPVQDFSRFDLNGDGFTGGSQTHRFDLDPTGSVQFGAAVHTDVTLEVAGEERTFDEAAVTDADVLCFYANTPLYTGEPDQRETILEDLGCGEPSPPSFAGTVTETFVGADGGTTVNITETYDIVLELKPDGDFETSGSARLLAVIDRTCEPGSIRQVLDASVSDPPGDIGDLGSDEEFAVGVVADVEGTNTEIGSGGCEENFVEPFETRIDTAFLSTPELVDGRVVALVWDAEAEAVDPFGFQVPGTLRVTGRAERVD
jgi:hypothetical protein